MLGWIFVLGAGDVGGCFGDFYTDQLIPFLLAVVGTAVPTYTPYILAALSFIIAALQVIGFYGVFKVRPPIPPKKCQKC
jgi:hypothetical protein